MYLTGYHKQVFVVLVSSYKLIRFTPVLEYITQITFHELFQKTFFHTNTYPCPVIKADTLEFIPLPALLLDITSRQILAINGSFSQLLSVKQSDIVGQKLSILLPWDTQQMLDRYVTQATSQPNSLHHHEIVWQMTDGSFKHLRLDCSITSVSPNTQVILTFLDIDKEKLLEKQLAHKTKVIDQVFEKSPIPKFILSQNNKILKANQEFCQMLGYSLEEVCQKNLPDVINPDDLPSFVLYQTKVSSKLMEYFELENRFLHQTGTDVFAVTHASMLYDEEAGENCFYIQAINAQARKEAEFERERFRSILNQAGEAILIADAQSGAIIDFNHTACRSLGYSQAELKELLVKDVIKEDSDILQRRFDALIRNPRKAIHFRVILQRKDKSHFPAQVSVNYRSFRGQKYLTAIARDISQELDSEIKILEGEARFKSIFEEIHMGIALTDAKGNFVECNQALADMLGYTRDEMRNLHIMDIAYPDDIKVHGDSIDDFFKVRSLEKQYRKKNGDILWGRLTNSAIRDKNGRLLYGVGMIEDITAHKIAEEKNIEHETLLNSINENLSEGIYRSTLDEGFIYINPAFALLFGFNRITEAYTVHPNDLYCDNKQREKLLKILERDGYFKNQEVLFRRKDGSTFWGLLNSHITRSKTGKTFYDGTIIDISTKKESEELLMSKNADLQKINSELDRFVYSASHDLRAPLTSILGLVHIANTENPPPNIATYLEMIKQSIHKLDMFVQDIINYSKNSRLKIASQAIDIEHLVRQSFSNLQFMKGADRIVKTVEVSKTSEQVVGFFSDPTRLTIILNNTISNAIKYHNPFVEKPFVKVLATINEEGVELEIKDNGKGIPAESIDRIFDMFYRASEDSNGSGLGLYIVKETVEKLRGDIKLESVFGEGTSINISLPNHSTEEQDQI